MNHQTLFSELVCINISMCVILDNLLLHTFIQTFIISPWGNYVEHCYNI